MLLDKLEDVMKHMNPIFYNHNEDYIIDSLSKGRLIAINHAGNQPRWRFPRWNNRRIY
jgi:hypothetical protein